VCQSMFACLCFFKPAIHQKACSNVLSDLQSDENTLGKEHLHSLSHYLSSALLQWMLRLKSLRKNFHMCTSPLHPFFGSLFHVPLSVSLIVLLVVVLSFAFMCTQNLDSVFSHLPSISSRTSYLLNYKNPNHRIIILCIVTFLLKLLCIK
jgi:hypothetical protein